MNQKDVGRLGETIARRYVEHHGYKIIHTNWHCHWGELDIVGSKQKRLYFFEVKTRQTDVLDSVSHHKLKHLFRTIQFYLKKYHHSFENFQVDFIGVELKHDAPKIIHLENVLEERI
ncbi:MAG: hypothetical protein A2Z91_04885 [Deltaproteobacteria bacterium GWA2_38_16]|nr:MAG: hypothetical protein A2Z91_04885 [Deltaproteobacteria bacterium GWA2_38_16]OGQ03117.1 MAG: hypothetical protein A3D19_03615 [Deltaproteobacteria bacterium RIFCSPHIGHO2_02_FULL_38_15]OGQ33827.1 MAG: hypothetical protein A3A72_08940 [Deltaproteobacteria bacterium RIFCSPLOWO2_01_FULL_38_9]OGQ60196.1 MAG: hypothetical protein A3G92_01765 [Deltaproteobacteria bacterium RIFCSPLOWO2_12_FULL_38_8]HBQ20463.1 hypothetical protein [Deltaproteobacteria bacterium]